MKPVLLAALAADDLREAHDWYEGRVPGQGRKLVQSVDLALTQIGERPLRFPVVHSDIRRALVKTFTYAVFFRDLPDFVRVIAIVHQHRDPRTWNRRR